MKPLIISEESTIGISNSSFHGAQGAWTGGAISAFGSLIDIESSSFTNNSAHDGGCINLFESSGEIWNSEFTNNSGMNSAVFFL